MSAPGTAAGLTGPLLSQLLGDSRPPPLLAADENGREGRGLTGRAPRSRPPRQEPPDLCRVFDKVVEVLSMVSEDLWLTGDASALHFLPAEGRDH